MVWNKLVPSKVAGFISQVAHGSISTIDNLVRRGFQLPNRCVLCESEAETIRHLFFECSFAVQVWSYLSSRLSLFGPFPSSVLEILTAWKGWNWERDFEPCGMALLHGVCWCLWLERNVRTFRDVRSSWEVSELGKLLAIGVWRQEGCPTQPERDGWQVSVHPGPRTRDG
ncbi:hypothetical protein LINPERPRIM_LOCUS39677 [Linum perenne]